MNQKWNTIGRLYEKKYGVSLLNHSAFKLYWGHHRNFQNHILIIGQDIDRIVALMCYIQVSLLGVSGFIKVGNTLTEPMSENDSMENYWHTPMYFLNSWRFLDRTKAGDNYGEN